MRIVKQLFSFAVLRQYKVTSLGTSNWVKNIFEFFIESIWLSSSLVVSEDGAPVITLIAFLPELWSTNIPATPVWEFSSWIILVVLM